MLEDTIIKSNMEEPEKACYKQDKQKKMVINIGKAGSGGLGGIILLAGVLATAAVASAALTLKRRNQKSSSNKSNNQQSPLKESNEILNDSNYDDEATKGLQMLVSDFSSEGHLQLSNGKTRKAMNRSDLTSLITVESLILNDEKMASVIAGGIEAPISIDGSMVKKEEFSSPGIDKLLQEAVIQIAKGDCIQQKIQIDKQQEMAEEIIAVGCSIQEGGDVDGGEFLHSSCDNLSFNKDAKLDNSCEEGFPHIGSDEVIKAEEAIEVALGDQIKDNGGEEVENRDRIGDGILVEKFDEAGEVKQDSASIALNEQKVENCDQLDEKIGAEKENTVFDQPLPESRQDEESGTKQPNSGEVHLAPANLIYLFSEVNQQPADHIEAIEDVENESLCRQGMVEEGNQIIQLIKQEKCDHDGEGVTVGEITEAPEILSAENVGTEDDMIARMRDEAEDAQDNEIDHDIVLAEDDPVVQTNDVEENAEDNEIDHNDNDGDDIFTAEDDPVAQMSDEEERAIDSETDDYSDDDDKEEEEEDQEIDGAEIVEASSEGTGDSSLESSAEAIWPTETIQEFSMVHEAAKLHEQKEEASNSQEEAEAGDKAEGKQETDRNGKPVEKCFTEFAPQHDQILKSSKWRIFIGTGLALLWLLCFRYFLAYPS